LFSVFNSDAINDAKFYKGGIPAQYGGRLSSVLDLSMREGNAHKYSGEIMLGTFSSKFLVEGPIYNEKTSFLVTGRRSILDISPEFIKNMTLFLSGIYKEQGYMERVDLYSFYDINTKINHSFSDRSRLYFSFYKGNDEYPTNKMMSDTYFNFGNTTFSVRWNYLFSNNLYSNITLYYSKFNYINTRGTLQKDSTGKAISGYSLRNTSGIEDYSGKVDFDYALLNHDLKFGAQYVKQNLDPGVYSYNSAGSNPQFNSDTTYNYNKEAHQGVLYVSDNFKPLDKLTINAGLRFDAYFVDNIVHASLQPRFSCNYQLINNLSIKASYTRVTQQLHLLSATSSGAPSDIWVPSTKKVAPSNSNEFVLGINYNFKNIVTLTVEGFTKYMNNLIMYKEGASYAIDKTDWQNMIETGKGKSQGIEFGLKKEKGNTTGWISYTLSRTTRQFDNINFGNEFPFTYDRTHNIAIALMQKLGKKFEIGADWLYATGNAITLSNTMYYNIVPLPPDEIYQSINHYESINGERMPTFHRLDVCINYNKTGKILSYKISLGAYNIYARQNPYYIIESPEGIKMESLFKVLPYLSLSLKF
jgi:outer membrane receptor for ferrienterochelin and colicin